jgi:nucleotide-binding universal stress UspA family protein
MDAMHTILHPTDFTEPSQAAYRVACSLARDHHSRLVIVHVLELPVAALLGGGLIPGPVAEVAEVRAKLQRLRAEGVEVEHRLVEGDPAAEVVRLAGELHADLIVMGTHGRSGLSRLLLGSVAEHVLRRCCCPVVTVRALPSGEGGS